MDFTSVEVWRVASTPSIPHPQIKSKYFSVSRVANFLLSHLVSQSRGDTDLI